MADKSAALHTVKTLDQMGELDAHLDPVIREDDSDDECQENKDSIKDEAGRPHAGTEKSKYCYKDQVRKSFCGWG